MSTKPEITSDLLTIIPLDDPTIEAVGYPPRSSYVERFWLSILGPTATLMFRNFDAQLSNTPTGVDVKLSDIALSLGLSPATSRYSPVIRSVNRLCQFGLARAFNSSSIELRRSVPHLTRRQIERLPDALKQDHLNWLRDERDAALQHGHTRRGRRLALGFVALGEPGPDAEQRLLGLCISSTVAADCVRWAQKVLDAQTTSREAHQLLNISATALTPNPVPPWETSPTGEEVIQAGPAMSR